MRKALLFGPEDLRVVDVPKPEPGPGQVTVRVIRSAPYGTDVEFYRVHDERYQKLYPCGLGADFAGIVEAVGAGVEGFRPGDRVVAMALYHCGTCKFCLAGRTNLCTANFGANYNRQECFEDVALVWANKLAHLPEAVSFDDGAMLSGVMMGLNIFEHLRPQPGERTVIVGAGAMGWPQIQLARHFGTEAIVVGRGAKRLEICRALGADHVIDHTAIDDAALVETVRRLTDGGADCVVETTVSEWGCRLSLEIAGMGGRVAWIGGSRFQVDPWHLVHHEITLVGIRAGHHQHQAIELVAAGAIDLKPSITRRITLEDLPAAFALLAGPHRGNVGRIMVEHDGVSEG